MRALKQIADKVADSLDAWQRGGARPSWLAQVPQISPTDIELAEQEITAERELAGNRSRS